MLARQVTEDRALSGTSSPFSFHSDSQLLHWGYPRQPDNGTISHCTPGWHVRGVNATHEGM